MVRMRVVRVSREEWAVESCEVERVSEVRGAGEWATHLVVEGRCAVVEARASRGAHEVVHRGHGCSSRGGS